MDKIINAIALWVLATCQLAQAQSSGLDKVIAIVNDEAITFSEYQVRQNRELLQNASLPQPVPNKIDIDILHLIIDERVQAQLARLEGITISESEVDSAIKNMAQQNDLSIEGILAQLRENNITALQFRRSIEEQILISRYIDIAVNSQIKISESEIDYHMQSHKELYVSEEAYELSHLFVSITGKSEEQVQSDLENISNIADAISKGLEFKKAVLDFSDSDKENDGYLGWKKSHQLPDLFLHALRNTPTGRVTEIITSSNGYHLLNIHGRKGDTKIVTQQLIRHILIQPERHNLTEDEAMSLALDIRKKLQEGEDFATIARLHSDDQSTSATSGVLGWVNPGETVYEFEEAAKALSINEISTPVKSRFGIHIIQVQDRQEKDIREELARQSARVEVFRRKFEEYFDIWISRIKDSAYIEIVAQ